MQAFLERQAPTAISLLFHAAVLLFLWSRVDVLPLQPEPPKPIVMHVVQPSETPEPGAGAEKPSMPPPLSQVQRTSPNPAEQPTPETPAGTEGTEEDEKAKAEEQKKDSESQEPTAAPTKPVEREIAKVPLDQQILEQFRAEQQKRQQELEARKSKIMTQIASIAPAEAPGVKRPYSSAGSDRGTVRELDIAHYPREMQARFLVRYDIKIQTKMVEGNPRQSYVNAVVTDRGTYLNSGGRGIYEVMTLSKKVLARMAELEEEELRKRKLDPLRSRVIEVVFGLREGDNGQVDLVVSRFRAEAIE